jgi:hypothetical protein
MRTRVLAACLLPLLLVMAAAGSKSNDGKGVASVGGSVTPSATPSLSPLERGIRYAQCMRQHGVPLPDPGPDGDLRAVTGDKDAIDEDVLRKAQEACKQYQPVASGPDEAAKLEGAREYSRCMRAQGVENFPDPDASGRVELPPEQNDPDYDQAKAICDAQARSPRPSPEANRS